MIAFDGNFSAQDLAATLSGLGRDVFFVQVGAMDGVWLDPIHEFVTSLAWRGILLEPLPDMFARLKANYAGCEGLTFIDAAITDFDGTIEMTRIDPAAVEQGALTDIALAISSMMPDRGMLGSDHRTEEFEKILAPHKRTLDVPCFRLQTVLDRHRVSRSTCS